MSRQARRRAEREAAKAGNASAARLLADAARCYADGDLAAVERLCRDVLARQPGSRSALGLLGHVRLQRKHLTDLRPHGFPGVKRDDPVAVALGLQLLGRTEDAEQVCRRALRTDPGDHRARMLLATLLREQERHDEAVAMCRRVTTAVASSYAFAELGLALRDQDRLVEAVRAYRHAVAADADNGLARLGLGAALLELEELDEALAQLREAERLEPHDPAAPSNAGAALRRMGHFEEAVEEFDRAVALRPDDPAVRYNRSFALLGSGDLPGGWDDYDLGFAVGDRTPHRKVGVPRWDGAPAPTRTLLVWREQGVGDEIRFASCYGDAAERVGRLVIECDPRLVGLFARSFPQATVRPASADPVTDVDLHCSAGTLPRFLRRSVEDFPAESGYLRAEPEAVERWRAQLDALGPGPKVGWCWRSGNLASDRLVNYTVPDEWTPLLNLSGVHVVSLQYGSEQAVASELADLRGRTGAVVHRWDDLDYTDDFDGVAALTAALDAVVGVNTTPLMLAGALGVPVHMLSRPHPLAFGTGRFPWMPSLRLHTRAWHESWQRPIAEISAAVAQRAA